MLNSFLLENGEDMNNEIHTYEIDDYLLIVNGEIVAVSGNTDFEYKTNKVDDKVTVIQVIEKWQTEDIHNHINDEIEKMIESKESMVDETIDIYKEDWNNPDKTRESLVEELEMLHKHGVQGFDNMTYDEVEYEYNEQKEQQVIDGMYEEYENHTPF